MILIHAVRPNIDVAGAYPPAYGLYRRHILVDSTPLFEHRGVGANLRSQELRSPPTYESVLAGNLPLVGSNSQEPSHSKSLRWKDVLGSLVLIVISIGFIFTLDHVENSLGRGIISGAVLLVLLSTFIAFAQWASDVYVLISAGYLSLADLLSWCARLSSSLYLAQLNCI